MYISNQNRLKEILMLIWIIFIILVCMNVMEINPVWTSKTATETGNLRDQYEKLADAFYHGHTYFEYEPDESLLAMENPYDYFARETENVKYKWDHALYNGHYYMYFGVVPVILLYLPYRILTGQPLQSYRGTQFFTAFIITGFFSLFRFLRKRFFPEMNDFIYISLGTAVSFASIWYFVTYPAMYCTAISSAVCMIIWSLFFYFRAVFDDISFRKKNRFLVYAAVFGALSFGCRPTVALANVVVIPLMMVFIKNNHFDRGQMKRINLSFLPYVIIGILLMYYNYIRFDDPFEFGQAYQLTFFDQHNLKIFNQLNLFKLYNGFVSMFWINYGISSVFPFVQFGGVFAEFPIFLFGTAKLLFSKNTRESLHRDRILFTAVSLLASAILITFADTVMSPMMLERYHSDIVFLLGIFCFLLVGKAYFSKVQENKRAESRKTVIIIIVLLCLLTILISILLFFVPYDSSYTELFPEKLEKLQNLFSFI